MRCRAVALSLACAAALGACGGDASPRTSGAATTTTSEATVPGGSLALPASVPLRATRDGDPAAIRVIRLWSEAMRRSDIRAAAALWSIPATVQNGTPVVTLATRADVRLFNDSMTCGSQLVSARGARGGFTIAVFKLIPRPGTDCGSGVGADARTAIRVRAGRIAAWYRLPDDPDAPARRQPAQPRRPVQPKI